MAALRRGHGGPHGGANARPHQAHTPAPCPCTATDPARHVGGVHHGQATAHRGAKLGCDSPWPWYHTPWPDCCPCLPRFQHVDPAPRLLHLRREQVRLNATLVLDLAELVLGCFLLHDTLPLPWRMQADGWTASGVKWSRSSTSQGDAAFSCASCTHART